MATLENAVEWLEGLRRKDLGPSADYAKLLLDQLDLNRQNEKFIADFHDRFEYKGDDPWPVIDDRIADANEWVALREEMATADIVTPGVSNDELNLIVRMFLPLT